MSNYQFENPQQFGLGQLQTRPQMGSAWGNNFLAQHSNPASQSMARSAAMPQYDSRQNPFNNAPVAGMGQTSGQIGWGKWNAGRGFPDRGAPGPQAPMQIPMPQPVHYGDAPTSYNQTQGQNGSIGLSPNFGGAQPKLPQSYYTPPTGNAPGQPQVSTDRNRMLAQALMRR